MQHGAFSLEQRFSARYEQWGCDDFRPRIQRSLAQPTPQDPQHIMLMHVDGDPSYVIARLLPARRRAVIRGYDGLITAYGQLPFGQQEYEDLAADLEAFMRRRSFLVNDRRRPPTPWPIRMAAVA